MTHDATTPSELDLIAALFPAFDFEGLIARGAAGPVYKARQRSLDRDVAIRLVPRETSADPVFRRSFQAMAKSMANLAHPGVIRVYDSGELEGQLFMVMEFVPGKSLRHSARGKAVEPRQATQIVLDLCQGLAHAHGKGIAHGALHPANVLLTQKCEPKIGNFGLISGSGPQETPAACHAPTPQADVHAIGLILQELLTGTPAGTAGGPPVAIPDARLAAICQKALHPDPAQRFPDAAAFADALGQWSAPRAALQTPLHRPTAAYRPMAPATTKAPAVAYPGARPGRGILVHATIIAALLLAIHGVWGAYQAKQESLARLRSMEESKPRIIIVNAQPGKETRGKIDSSLVQLKP
jgi:serine/threonine protein kinase